MSQAHNPSADLCALGLLREYDRYRSNSRSERLTRIMGTLQRSTAYLFRLTPSDTKTGE